MLKLGIRVSTIKSSGKGHFQRCLNIRKIISEEVNWFLDFKSKDIMREIPKIDKVFFENGIDKNSYLEKAIEKKNINFVLIDNYNIKNKKISKINEKVNTAVLIDVYKNINADIIICPQPINVKFSNKIKYLCGPKYAPISKNFLLNKSNFDSKLSILISFGSYDSKGVTLKVIKAIKKMMLIDKFNSKVIVTLGKNAPIINKVKDLIKEFSNFELILESKNLESLYKISSISIGAPGLSHLERLAAGLPSILISQNKIHDKLLDKWISLGCAIKSENKIHSIANSINFLYLDKELCKKISMKGKKLVDGRGAQRIVSEIKKFANSQ